jgi:hypothetical protein
VDDVRPKLRGCGDQRNASPRRFVGELRELACRNPRHRKWKTPYSHPVHVIVLQKIGRMPDGPHLDGVTGIQEPTSKPRR